jgi:hypothetical protein
MNVSELKTNNKILGVMRLVAMNNSDRLLIDVNKDNRLEHNRDTFEITEPILDLKANDLKQFVQQNSHEGLVTKDCIGEIPTRAASFGRNWSIKWGEQNGTLTESAQQLNPLKDLAKGQQVQWAIDPSSEGGDLYLYLPKKEGESC